MSYSRSVETETSHFSWGHRWHSEPEHSDKQGKVYKHEAESGLWETAKCGPNFCPEQVKFTAGAATTATTAATSAAAAACYISS